jgi:hypothetical protein
VWRQRAGCKHCRQTSHWCRDREESRREILRHLRDAHGLGEAQESVDYQIVTERQCDTCLEPYLDHCTKCDGDFCTFHAGDIDGLCGGCI